MQNLQRDVINKIKYYFSGKNLARHKVFCGTQWITWVGLVDFAKTAMINVLESKIESQ